MPAKLVAGEAVFIGLLGPPDKGAVMQTIDGRLSIGAEVVEVGPTTGRTIPVAILEPTAQ